MQIPPSAWQARPDRVEGEQPLPPGRRPRCVPRHAPRRPARAAREDLVLGCGGLHDLRADGSTAARPADRSPRTVTAPTAPFPPSLRQPFAQGCGGRIAVGRPHPPSTAKALRENVLHARKTAAAPLIACLQGHCSNILTASPAHVAESRGRGFCSCLWCTTVLASFLILGPCCVAGPSASRARGRRVSSPTSSPAGPRRRALSRLRQCLHNRWMGQAFPPARMSADTNVCPVAC